jgi:hypothetical protein
MGVVFSIAGITILKVATRGSDMTKRDIESIRTYWTNEGILRLTLRAITLDNGSGGFPSDLYYSAEQPVSFSKEIILNGYKLSSAQRDIDITVKFLDCGPGVYTITSRTRMNGTNLCNVSKIDTAVIKSMPRYTFFEDNTADAAVNWKEFVVDGDFHSNGIIKVSSDMSAVAHVTKQATTSGTTAPVETYPDPYDMGIAVENDALGTEPWLKKRFPDYSHVGRINTDFLAPSSFPDNYVYNSSGQPYDVDLAFEFTSLKVNVYYQSGTKWVQITPSLNKIIKTKKNAWVWGSGVSGCYTIVSEQKIYLAGEIKYTGGATGSDALALVSGSDIVIPNSFTLKVGSATKHSYSFLTKSSTTVNACMFMKNGGLSVEGIDSYTKKATSASLNKLEVVGCVMVKQDKEKIWQYDNGNYSGLNCKYIRDLRYYNNMITPPGIPFPKALDEERSDKFASNYMWVFAAGKWYNYLEQVQ